MMITNVLVLISFIQNKSKSPYKSLEGSIPRGPISSLTSPITPLVPARPFGCSLSTGGTHLRAFALAPAFVQSTLPQISARLTLSPSRLCTHHTI